MKSESDQERSGDAQLQSPDPNEDDWPVESELVQDEKHEDAPRSVVPASRLINQPLMPGMQPPDLCAAQLENARL